MTHDEQAIFDALKAKTLPRGWTCEPEFGYRRATHLIAPKRKGGVIVKDRAVRVQLPGDGGPCSPVVVIAEEVKGRGWLKRIVALAVGAAEEYAPTFRRALGQARRSGGRARSVGGRR